MPFAILDAQPDDAPAILTLQRLAYRSEADIYGEANVPPLAQTLEELRAEFGTMVLLKAVDHSGRLVGSVRGKMDTSGDTCNVCSIGRLIVQPDRQRQGLGTALVHALEARFPQARRFSLFTGSRSEGNLRLYTRLGYHPVRSQMVNPSLTLIFLERPQL